MSTPTLVRKRMILREKKNHTFLFDSAKRYGWRLLHANQLMWLSGKMNMSPIYTSLRALPLMAALLALLACSSDGGDEPSSSSSSQPNSSQSSSASSSVPSPMVGVVATGKALYDGGLCAGCHGLKGASTLSTGGNIIDMANLNKVSPNQAALQTYIEEQMPANSPAGCTAQCAADAAAYLMSWLNNNSSSSSVSSSSSSTNTQASGADLYVSMGCQTCHGDRGTGTTEIIAQNWNLEALTIKIRDTMPLGNETACNEECASAIAAYILTWVSAEACSSDEALLPRRLRLLTPREYQLTVNDLLQLGAWNNAARNLPKTETVRGYDNNAPEIRIGNAHVSQYWAAALELAQTTNVTRLANCGTLTMNACADQWLTQYGSKAYRRPLTAEENQEYTELFLSADNNEEGLRLTLKSLLMSPNFIYRSEMGTITEQGDYQLTPYEVASLLSYTFWGSMPDQTLFDAAANNALNTAAQLRSQTERLLANDRAKAQLVYFAKQWLGATNVSYISKDLSLFPKFNTDVSLAMEEEMRRFIADAFLSGTRSFADLFTADYVFVNNTLANYYDIPGVTSSSFSERPAGAQRGGLLNLGAVQVSHAKMEQTSPIARGVFVRERLLCQKFPAPPANAGAVVPLNPNASTRERFSAHTDNDGCRSCHEKIDPIGFSFERYDGAGHYREVEGNNIPVDDSGSVTGLVRMADTDFQAYNGTAGLSQILAQADSAAACLADQFQTYVQGVNTPDACTTQNITARWREKNYNLYDLWLETVLTNSFIRRQ